MKGLGLQGFRVYVGFRALGFKGEGFRADGRIQRVLAIRI